MFKLFVALSLAASTLFSGLSTPYQTVVPEIIQKRNTPTYLTEYVRLDEESAAEYTFEAASFTTYFDSTQINRSINLEIACRYLDYIELQPGDEFSFNMALGPRTAAKGYRSAPIISGGGYVNSLGGGICQITSTLFNAVLLANLEITLRYYHGRMVSYVAPGRDATVYWGTQDFRFKNSYDFPILIRAIYDNEAETVIISVHAKEEFTLPGIFIEVHRGTVTGKWYTNRYADGVLNYTCESKYLS